MRDLEHAIRERAYHLWIADGCAMETPTNIGFPRSAKS
jgi:hypothetical protein